VRDHFNNAAVRAASRLGQILGALHGRRIEADYRLEKVDVETQPVAVRVVERARRTIQELREFPDSPDAKTAVAAMTIWVSAGKPR